MYYNKAVYGREEISLKLYMLHVTFWGVKRKRNYGKLPFLAFICQRELLFLIFPAQVATSLQEILVPEPSEELPAWESGFLLKLCNSSTPLI